MTEQREKRLIVSMASYRGRINVVAWAIASLLNQTMKPDKIILWLDEDKFPDRKLPRIFKKVRACGVEIRFCEDIGPHKKYFFAMQEYPDDLLLTFDDDIVYDRDVIETLYKSYLKHPVCVSGMRVHKITFSPFDDSIQKYTNWDMSCKNCAGDESYKYFVTGVGGALYPPHSLHAEAFNLEAIKELCPKADDIWLKFMELLNNTKTVAASDESKIPGRVIYGSQKKTLWYSNVFDGENDVQIKALLDKYNTWPKNGRTILEILKEEA